MTEVTVLGTSDLHGFVPAALGRAAGWDGDDPSVAGGHAAGIMAGSLAMQRFDPATSILIDAGDFFLGSAYTSFLEDDQCAAKSSVPSPLSDMAVEFGYAAMAPGNHDFDHGSDFLRRQVPVLGERLVCCNVTDADGVPLFPAYRMVQVAQVRVCVIGAVTGALPQLTAFANTADIHVLNPVECVRDTVTQVRQDCDLVVVAYHGGIECDMGDGHPTEYATGEDEAYRMLSEVPGIDGLLCGHQHRTACGESQGAVYVQPGYQGSHVGCMRFTIGDDGSVLSREASLIDMHGMDPGHGADERRDADWGGPGSRDDANFLESGQEDLLARQLRLEDYRHWMDESVDVSGFAQYVADKTGIASYRYSFMPHGGVIARKDFKRAFPAPYSLSVFHLGAEQYRHYANAGLIGHIGEAEPQADPLGGYRIITNDPAAFPAYRLESRTVDNLFDEYLHYCNGR